MCLTPLGTLHLLCAASHTCRLTEQYGRPVVRVSPYVFHGPPLAGYVRFATCLTPSFGSTISLRGMPWPVTPHVVYGLNSKAGTHPDRPGSTRDYVHTLRAGQLGRVSSGWCYNIHDEAQSLYRNHNR